MISLKKIVCKIRGHLFSSIEECDPKLITNIKNGHVFVSSVLTCSRCNEKVNMANGLK
jgi:hypothetical protein